MFNLSSKQLYPQRDLNYQQETSLDQFQGSGDVDAIPNCARNGTILCMEFMRPVDLIHLLGVGFEIISDVNSLYH
jgi:hypothetical protein